MLPISFRSKIFYTMLLATLAALALPMYYARTTLHNDLLNEAKGQSLREIRLAARLLNALPAGMEPERYLDELREADARFTLLAPDGTVLADSIVKGKKFEQIDNHNDRPEFKSARQYGEGLSTRYSNTLHTDMIYAAITLHNGQLLRMALPFAGLKARIDGQVTTFYLVVLGAALLSLLLALTLSGWLKGELAQMVKVVEAISLGKYQRRLRRLPGKEFAPLANAVNRMAANIEEHVCTVAEQKEQLQSILETMTEGVLVLGQQGCILRCNRALTNMFPAAARSSGAQVVEVIPVPALQEAVEELLTIAPSSPESERIVGPLQLELSPGHIFAVHMVRAGLEHLNMGAVVVFHDITDIMRLERVRRDFVANVSHELRTPLTAIQGYAETLSGLEGVPEDCRRFAEVIRKNGAYLARMVEDLLSLARLENSEIPLTIASVRVQDSLQSAVTLCRQYMEKRRIDIVTDIPDSLSVMANTQHLVQVFRNLLENAIRYAPEGGQVIIKGSKDPQNTHMARFAVCDHGPGIPAADLQRIFERFYRVEKHRSQSSTGLGLAICRHSVDRLGGRIWAESPAKEFATCFYFTLPIASGE